MRQRITQETKTFTTDEILREFGDGTRSTPAKGKIRRTLPRAGKYLKWGGPLIFGGSLVWDALHWFYNEAKRSTGTDLDKWFLPDLESDDLPIPSPLSSFKSPELLCYNKRIYPERSITAYYIVSSGQVRVSHYSVRFGGPMGGHYISRESALNNCANSQEDPESPLSSLPSDAQTQVSRVLRDYLTSPRGAPAARTIPDVAQFPYNLNQWEDNPYSDPSLDTDGDGYSDPDEYEDMISGGSGDPNDSDKTPVGQPKEISRTTETTTNPDGSTTTTTTIRYSDGSTATTTTTTTTTRTTNPDGSTTVRRRVVTETTDRRGNTRREEFEETERQPPAPELERNDCIRGGGIWMGSSCQPAENPDGKRANCILSGGVWDASTKTCAIPEQDAKEKKKLNCTSQGWIWDGNSCTPAGEQEKRRICVRSGGFWDGFTCVVQPEKDKNEERDKNLCTGQGGTWNPSTKTCTQPEQEDEKEQNCTSQLWIWNPSTKTCTQPEQEKEKDKEDQKKRNCTGQGGTWDATTKICTPSKDLEKELNCRRQQGSWNFISKTCTLSDEMTKEEECLKKGGQWSKTGNLCVNPDKDRPSNECGNFSIKRFLTFPGPYIKDLFVPCKPLDDIFRPLAQLAATKFPFSLSQSLGKMITYSGDSQQSAVLPDQLGPFVLDWSWLGPTIIIISGLFKAFFAFLTVNFILAKLSGQLVLK